MPDARLQEADADADPLVQFRRWFAEAQAVDRHEANAMAVATATPDGGPSVRMVLLKGIDERGFVFFTGYGSRKGRELEANPRAALLFHWPSLGRQVRIEGPVERVAREETVSYARSRPRGSQLSALASPQSEVISARGVLEAKVSDLREQLAGEPELPVAEGWGGFRVLPEAYEFWQHREDRLHDRLEYRRAGSDWRRARLAP
ncbi:MAG TPA: pyridoxamine 5'-phosphate oxidase [Solirubrobacteraceae bacterium]|nr:pyridoxamine 5'-phosphate oxidase [Solirubrobacteraceae bacterium]